MPIRTPEQIRAAALSFLETRGSGIRTDAGQPIVDLVDSQATEQGKLNVILDYAIRINSLPGWRSIISDESFKQQLADALGIGYDRVTADYIRSIGAPADISSDVEARIYVDLSNFATSFGRPRRAATFARATQRFLLSSGGAFTLARGASVRRSSSQSVVYDTVQPISVASPSLDLSTGVYYVDATVKCRTAGTVGNAIRGAINTSSGAPAGVTRVTNTTAAEGGFERETNVELVAALANVQSGTNINTDQGLLNYVLSQTNVTDAILIKAGDPLMTRSAAGAVDIYVVGTRPISVTAKSTIETDTGEYYTLPLQPVISISSAVDDSSNPYFDGGGYTFVQDTGSYVGSSRAHAQLHWGRPDPDGVGPAVAAVVTVIYIHDALPRDIQRKLEEDTKLDVPASNLLVRLATRVGVTCQLAVVPIAGLEDLGLTADDVNDAVQTSLSTYFDSLKLGKPANFSTVEDAIDDTVIAGVKVVDHVDGFMLSKTGGALGYEDLKVAGNEYLRLDTATFLV